MTSEETIEFPKPIIDSLTRWINACWYAPSPDATAALEALPRELPEGEVHLLASGGGFGLFIEGRIDRVDGRIALEIYCNDRMAGDGYYRIWEDGEQEDMPVDRDERLKSSGYDEMIDEVVPARGFMQHTTNAQMMNRYLEGRS
jgi:hypothetical protein